MGESFQKKKLEKSGYKPRPKFHKKVYLSECPLKSHSWKGSSHETCQKLLKNIKLLAISRTPLFEFFLADLLCFLKSWSAYR